jgi:hypothetical protein
MPRIGLQSMHLPIGCASCANEQHPSGKKGPAARSAEGSRASSFGPMKQSARLGVRAQLGFRNTRPVLSLKESTNPSHYCDKNRAGRQRRRPAKGGTQAQVFLKRRLLAMGSECGQS